MTREIPCDVPWCCALVTRATRTGKCELHRADPTLHPKVLRASSSAPRTFPPTPWDGAVPWYAREAGWGV